MTDNPGHPAYPPGVWEDDTGALHFDLEAMVRGAGYEPNADNLRAMEKAAHDMAAQIGASIEVVVDAFVCPRCGAASHNPTDIAEQYCGRCHDWTGTWDPRGGDGGGG